MSEAQKMIKRELQGRALRRVAVTNRQQNMGMPINQLRALDAIKYPAATTRHKSCFSGVFGVA